MKDPNNVLKIDPNVFEEKFNKWAINYDKKLKKYQLILKKSPIPIIISSQTVLFNTSLIFKDIDWSNKRFLGLYFSNCKIDGLPKEFIFINGKISIDKKITAYFHELGHYYCYTTICYCFKREIKNNDILSEAHALRHEIEESIKLNLPIVLSTALIGIIKNNFAE